MTRGYDIEVLCLAQLRRQFTNTTLTYATRYDRLFLKLILNHEQECRARDRRGSGSEPGLKLTLYLNATSK